MNPETNPTTELNYTRPAAHVHQTQEGYSVALEIPGCKKEDVDISVEDGKLRITALRKKPEHLGTLVYSETPSAGYRRLFDLDPSIDVEKIVAETTNGVLTVTLPKAEACKARKIAVS